MLDDVQLAQVTLGLSTYLAGSPRWRKISGTDKWEAWEKLDGGSLAEEWNVQPFVGRPARSHAARTTQPIVLRFSSRRGAVTRTNTARD